MSTVTTRLSLTVAAAILLQPPYFSAAQESSVLERQLRQTFSGLQEVEVKGLGTDVPAKAASLLPVFKHQLRDVFTAVLEQSKDASGAELKRLFENAITHAGLKVGDPWQGQDVFKPDDPAQLRLLEHPYGTVKAVDVQMVQDRVVVTTTLVIACGSDTSLYVFERAFGSWRRTLEFESNGYKDVAGARGSFDWKIGGGQAPGEWFLIAAM